MIRLRPPPRSPLPGSGPGCNETVWFPSAGPAKTWRFPCHWPRCTGRRLSNRRCCSARDSASNQGNVFSPLGFPQVLASPKQESRPGCRLRFETAICREGPRRIADSQLLLVLAIHLLKRLVKWARGALGAHPGLLMVNGAASSASISPLVTEDTAKSNSGCVYASPASFCCASAPPAGIPSSPMPALPACLPACLQLVVTA